MAGSKSLGVLTLDLVVRAGAFTQGMTAAERQANKSLSAIEKRAYAFGRTVGTAIKAGAVLATAALTAVAVAVGQAIDRADEMRDLSIRTGIATEKLSEYAYAAKQTGTDIEGLSRGLKLLAKNAAEAADASSGKGKLFDALGVNVKDAEGNLKQLDVLLPEVADKFKDLEDGTTKAALAQELFGKSGLDLIEFLNQGSEGLDAAAAKAKALGIIISTDTANAADEFNDKLADLRAATEGFALQLAAKLLPQLIELVDKVNLFVGNGENATKIANGLVNTMDFLGTAFTVVGKTTDVVNAAMGTFIGLLASATQVAQGLLSLDFSKIGSGLSGGLAALRAGADFAINGVQGPKQRKTLLDPNRPDFGDVSSRVQGQKTLEEQLAEYFKGTSGATKKKGGPKEGAKEVDKLTEAYKRQKEQLEENFATFGQTSEAARLLYETQAGGLAALDKPRKDELIALAERNDAQKLSNELMEAAEKASLQESERITEGIKATDEVIDQLEFELSLIGIRNSELEKAIALRHLDANATDEQRARVAELTEELIRASENQQFLDDFKEGLADAFVDFVSGAKSAKEAFGDFADALFKRALQFVADKAIQAMFDAFNGNSTQASTGGGSGGGWQQWLGTIMGAFTGGKAAGGSVSPWSIVPVNEMGMEGLTVGGKDYLMTGSKAGVVTPANRMGGGGFVQNNTWVVREGNPQRTQEQTAQKMGQKVEEIQRRNS